MRVKAIKISKVLGIDELEIKPGKVTTISGANEVGKTSIIEAIKAAIGGGHDVSLLRQGADQGEIVLLLDDGVTVTKTITQDGSKLTVKHPEFGAISAGQTYLNKLFDALSVNPIEFLFADKKKRVEALLEAIPMSVNPKIIKEKAGIEVSEPECIGHALTVIDRINETRYMKRREVNRAIKEKTGTINQLREQLPEEPEDGAWSEKYSAIQEERDFYEAQIRDQIEGINQKADKTTRKVTEEFELAFKEIVQWQQEQIDAIRRQAEEKKAAIDAKREKACTAIERDRKQDLAELEEPYQQKIKALSESLAEAKAKAEEIVRATKTEQFIESLSAETSTLQAESDGYTTEIQALADLKQELLKDLPIKGLEVSDGEILLDGLSFDRVNESKRIQLAIEIAKLRAGDLGLVTVDGLERLDKKHFEEFEKQAAKSDLQFVVARVTDGPLSIKSKGEEAA